MSFWKRKLFWIYYHNKDGKCGIVFAPLFYDNDGENANILLNKHGYYASSCGIPNINNGFWLRIGLCKREIDLFLEAINHSWNFRDYKFIEISQALLPKDGSKYDQLIKDAGEKKENSWELYKKIFGCYPPTE